MTCNPASKRTREAITTAVDNATITNIKMRPRLLTVENDRFFALYNRTSNGAKDKSAMRTSGGLDSDTLTTIVAIEENSTIIISKIIVENAVSADPYASS